MIPDLDVIGLQYGIAYSDPLGHRGFTHSILFAMIVAPFMTVVTFPKIETLTRTWWSVVSLAFLATISHGVLDAFTDAGLGVGFLIPFDDTRYFSPWRPLATSPLSVSAFFEGPALRILANEIVWVGIPLAGLLVIGRFVRVLREWK
jgi:inner membrane protein